MVITSIEIKKLKDSRGIVPKNSGIQPVNPGTLFPLYIVINQPKWMVSILKTGVKYEEVVDKDRIALYLGIAQNITSEYMVYRNNEIS